jgi:hypothetical protein
MAQLIDINYEMIIKGHEKAIEYSADLVSEGDLIGGKSILDQTLKNLSLVDL